MRKWLMPVLWFALCFTFAACSGAGLPARPGQVAHVFGSVYDAKTEEPIGGVEIQLGPSVARSDDAGRWALAPIGYGVHLLEVAATATHSRHLQWVPVDRPEVRVPVRLEPPAGDPPTSDEWEAKADLVIATGLTYLGTPYRWGGKWHVDGTFDCSNFVAHVFQEALGRVFTTSSRGQALLGEPVALGDIRKGDLLFFWTPSRGRDEVGHVAIYMGDDSLLHTYAEGIGVTTTGFLQTWWEDHYLFVCLIGSSRAK